MATTGAARVPPSAVDAEAAVISACVLSPAAFDEVQRLLRPEHFYDDAHARVWDAILHLAGESRRIDVVSIASRLREVGRLDQVGGSPYLLQLIDATPSVANVVEHATIVRDRWRARSVIGLLQTKAAEGYDVAGSGEHLDRWLADIAGELETLSRAESIDTQATIGELVRAEATEIKARAAAGSSFDGLPTGIAELDGLLNGLKRGVKYEVAARPGQGKTGFLLSVARNIAASGFGVVLISIEMPSRQLTQRAIAQQGQIDTKNIERGNLSDTDWRRYTTACSQVASLPIVFDEAGHQSVLSIRAAVRRAVRRLRKDFPGVQLGFIGIDYLQLVEGTGRRGESREQELEAISRGTAQIAKEMNCVVMELSQLNRDCEKRPDKRPQMADLRGSGAIEQDAYGIIMLYREDYYRAPDAQKDGLAEILVRKLRQGGETGRAFARFHGPSAGFFDVPAEQHIERHRYIDD